MPPILIHVGLAKAGSTLLQEHVFPRTEATVIRACQLMTDWPGLSVASRLLETLPSREPSGRVSLRAEAAVSEKCLLPRIPSDPLIISSEGMLGSVWNPVQAAQPMLSGIRRVFPDARVLIIIREQVSWLESVYRQTVLTERRFGFEAPFSWMYPSVEQARVSSDWNQLWLTAAEIFGQGAVKMMPLEYLTSQPRDSLRQISEFSEIKFDDLGRDPLPVIRPPEPERIMKARLVAWARGLELVLKRPDLMVRSRGGEPLPESGWGRGNSRLAESIGFDLGGLGYET